MNPDGVGLGASATLPGSAPRPSAGGEAATVNAQAPRAPICDPTGRVCRDQFTVTGPLDGRGPITLSDLVNFRPLVQVHRVQPDGWSVVGLHTNFYTATVAQVQDDLLLGIPASVRFTPVTYRWDYGDGESATTQTGGRSWSDLGLDEFDRTPTSHVYTRSGTFDITLAVDFGAEYRFGEAGWIPIAGSVSVPANSLTVSASEAKTVLVGRECTARALLGC
ncbi:PKD domain-containing protein [Marisediminicola antarctica]|uniref:PKD domain-containing protein n=1 Tax=Marisediminicola antarctica TaxID=674079 RepID=A0A7L5AHI8_9MICO|nr:PKD domain-containing protein [Marisediminicola antarctica]QHO69472.1 hypothetical protein BHD05_07270 [Marisediminicola antarctica]